MLEKSAIIMIVDDMKMVRTSIKKYLTSLGYQNFIEAENGNEAVKKLIQGRAESLNIKLVLCDIVMPFMDGKAVLQKVREIDSSLPVVMLSSVADQKTIDECKALGAFDYLLKPINADTGPKILKDLLGKLG
jgi:CheY-like chemotaxis protein